MALLATELTDSVSVNLGETLVVYFTRPDAPAKTWECCEPTFSSSVCVIWMEVTSRDNCGNIFAGTISTKG